MNVQVHFFKASGTWYTAEEVSWPYYGTPTDTPFKFADAIEIHTRSGSAVRRFAGMTAVCTDTNPLGFPQMCVVPE